MNSIKTLIQDIAVENYCDNKSLLWEYAKCRIRLETMTYSSIKAKLIKGTIQEAKEDIANLNGKQMAWDFVKCRIRTESISFAIKKGKRQRERINSLSQRLTYLEEKMTSSPSHLELEEYDSIKSEIEDYYEQIAGHPNSFKMQIYQ